MLLRTVGYSEKTVWIVILGMAALLGCSGEQNVGSDAGLRDSRVDPLHADVTEASDPRVAEDAATDPLDSSSGGTVHDTTMADSAFVVDVVLGDTMVKPLLVDAGVDVNVEEAKPVPPSVDGPSLIDQGAHKDGGDAATDVANGTTDSQRDVGAGVFGEVGNCAAQTLSLADSAAFFPLDVGGSWMYRGSEMSSDVVMATRLYRREVTGTRLVGGSTASVVTESWEGGSWQPTDEYLRLADSGLWTMGGSESPSAYGAPGLFAVPFMAIPFPLQTCAPYEAFDVSGATAPDQDGDGIPETVTARDTSLLSFEDVTVPVGTFKKALRVESVVTVTITGSRAPSPSQSQARRTVAWYASGVGLVKRYLERDRQTSTLECIGYAVGEARHALLPAGWIAQDVDQAESNPYTSNRPAIAFDGERSLVVIPTSTDTGNMSDTGNLLAVVVDREGKPVRSNLLLDSSSELHSVAVAWNGQRYLVGYHNAGYDRLELVTVSSDGQILNGPIVFKEGGQSPSIVGTLDGFLVSYTVTKYDYPTMKYIANLWTATVDGFGHAMGEHVQPFAVSQQWSASLAKDDGGAIMALFNIPPATPSRTAPETADILAVARFGADGHSLDAAPIAVDAVPGVGHDETAMIFDGTNFVVSWMQEIDSSTVGAHIARVSPTGTLLGGSPTTGASVLVSHGNRPRIARFGSGSIMVWGHRLSSDYFSQGIGAARFTSDGVLSDLASGDDSGRWMLAANGAGGYSIPEIVWLGDRALLVWATATTGPFDLGGALAFPW